MQLTENITKGFLTELGKGDFHKFYIAENGSLWIVGFYEGDTKEDYDPFVFAKLNVHKNEWWWEGTSPRDFDTFFSGAQEFDDLEGFRPFINQYKQERPIQGPQPQPGF